MLVPTCPNCRNYCFGHPIQCPECHYDFVTKSTNKSQEEIDNDLLELEELIEIEKRERLDTYIAQQQELAKSKSREDTFVMNKHKNYEYCTVYWAGTRTGMFPQTEIDSILAKYAREGWRLHTMLKIDAILLVFEREK